MERAQEPLVYFEASRPLHLKDRTVLKLRLCLMHAREAARRKRNGFDPDRFDRLVADPLEEVLKLLQDRRMRPLDEAVRLLIEQASAALTGKNDVDEACEPLSAFIGFANCTLCSGQERKCDGSFRDKKLFTDPAVDDPRLAVEQSGGQCLNFARMTVAAISTRVNAEVLALLGPDESLVRDPEPLALPPPPSRIRLVVRGVGDRPDGTLPLNGSFSLRGGDDEATLTLELPGGGNGYETVDRSLKLLPYLIFHELFVHGCQGRALGRDIGEIANECAFTEGFIDSAGRQLFFHSILNTDAVLPDPLKPLLDEMATACMGYYDERKTAPPRNVSNEEKKTQKYRIANSRAEGFLYFDALERLANGPSASQQIRDRWWSQRVAILLNLQLDKDMREEFVRLMQLVLPQHHDELRAEFCEYLAARDSVALLAAMRRIVDPPEIDDRVHLDLI